MEIKGYPKEHVRQMQSIFARKEHKLCVLKNELKAITRNPELEMRFRRIVQLYNNYQGISQSIKSYLGNKKYDPWLRYHQQHRVDTPGLPWLVNGYLVVRQLPMSMLETHDSDAFKVFRAKGCKCSHPGCNREGMKLLELVAADLSLHVKLCSEDNQAMTIDHILPKAKGGGNTLDNYQTMCSEHNLAKGDTIPISLMMKPEENKVILTQNDVLNATALDVADLSKIDITVAHKLLVLNTYCSQKKIEFSLSFKALKKLMLKKRCFYSLECFTEGDTTSGRMVDIVDPSRGMVDDNVVVCTRFLGQRKADLTLLHLKKLVKGIEKFNTQKVKPKSKLKLIKKSA